MVTGMREKRQFFRKVAITIYGTALVCAITKWWCESSCRLTFAFMWMQLKKHALLVITSVSPIIKLVTRICGVGNQRVKMTFISAINIKNILIISNKSYLSSVLCTDKTSQVQLREAAMIGFDLAQGSSQMT